ncbi:MAG: DUF1015 family protein [Coriobacteriaceae bacterium]|nr:DUF1015 family protein [Coriobacteriaceae bacterium]
MKALPFPCIRPVPERAAEFASTSHAALRDAGAAHDAAERLRSFIENGTLVEDKNLAYYIYEITDAARSRTGIVAVCAVDEYESSLTEHQEFASREALPTFELIKALGCQNDPVCLAYPDQPVLDMIIAAAKTSTPLYSFLDETGTRHKVWEVVRRDAVDALRAMLATIPHTRVFDGGASAAGAMIAARDMRAAAQKLGTYSGKEPFNFFLSILFPESHVISSDCKRNVAENEPDVNASSTSEKIASAESTESDSLTSSRGIGLFVHRIAKKIGA